MRKSICVVIMLSMMLLSTKTIYAIEPNGYLVGEVTYGTFVENTQESIQEDLPCPYTRYIMGVNTHIIDKEDGKLYMGVEVYCSEEMQEIKTVFYLQQLINGVWVDVCSHTTTVEDTVQMIAFVSVSYPPSGTYRTRTIVMATDYYGYVDATEGNSGAIDFVSSYT